MCAGGREGGNQRLLSLSLSLSSRISNIEKKFKKRIFQNYFYFILYLEKYFLYFLKIFNKTKVQKNAFHSSGLFWRKSLDNKLTRND